MVIGLPRRFARTFGGARNSELIECDRFDTCARKRSGVRRSKPSGNGEGVGMLTTVEAKAMAMATNSINAMKIPRRVQRRRRPDGSKNTGLDTCFALAFAKRNVTGESLVPPMAGPA